MKSAAIILGLALSVAAISPHHAHHSNHRHENKAAKELRKKDLVTEAVQVTVVECWLGKQKLSEGDCQEGIKNGTLKWADDGSLATALLTSVAYQTLKASSTSKSSSSSSSSSSSTTSSSSSTSSSPAAKPTTPAVASPTKQSQATPASSSSSSSSSSGGGSGVDKEFPDGTIDCGHFPWDYGAIPIDWLNLGGWASVQKPGITLSAGFNDILGVTKAQCTGSGCCLEGSFCSYACPEGYLKYQWPSTQGLTGQSVGGLECKNGKLYRTNKSVKTLCATGASEITVKVQNKLSKNVAICRTNYPGDEKMSIPVDSQPGTTRTLACPDASTFYMWEGKGTSAQYYINMPGYSVEKACVWGDEGDDFGNYAPGNLGVGWTNGRAWLSIMANHPTQMKVTLPYTIEIVGGDSKCRYRDGKYCSGDGYDNCSSEGCTVSSSGGTVTYVLS